VDRGDVLSLAAILVVIGSLIAILVRLFPPTPSPDLGIGDALVARGVPRFVARAFGWLLEVVADLIT